jgi:glycosyltransferase involved in cell wall biosynthesis
MPPGAARAVIAEVRRRAASADVVQGTGYFTNLLVRRAARGLSARVVNLVQTEPTAVVDRGGSPLEAALRRAIDRSTGRRVDAFIAVSAAIGESLMRARFPRERVFVVHNGVDPAALRAQAEGSAPAGMPDGTGSLVGSIARLEPVKGIGDFIAAAGIVSEGRPDVRFVIAGTGPLETELRTAAVAGLGSRLALVGHVARPAQLIVALDVLVLASLSEGLPTVLLEAGALGVPVVATAVGGTPEIVVDGVTGLLVPPRDPAALADAITALVRDPDRARAMGEAGRRRVEEHFTADRMVAETLAIYEGLLAR